MVNLVACIAAEGNVGKNTNDGENVERNLPGTDIMSLARERSPSGPLHFKHVRLLFEVDKNTRDGCSEWESRREQSDVAKRHNHLEIVIKLFDFFFFKLGKFLLNDFVSNSLIRFLKIFFFTFVAVLCSLPFLVENL